MSSTATETETEKPTVLHDPEASESSEKTETIEGDAAAEATDGDAETTDKKKKAVIKFDPCVIIDNAGHGFGIHIPNNDLRQFLQGTIVPYDVIDWEDLHMDGDTKAKKQNKDRKAVYSITAFINEHTTERLRQIPPSRFSHGDASLKAAYKQFYELLKDAKERFEREALAAIAANAVSYEHLAYAFQKDALVIVDEDGTPIAGKVNEFKSFTGWGGTYHRIRMKVNGWTGSAFAQGTHEAYVDYFEGTKTFEELSFIRATPEVLTSLAERGKRYVALNTQASYIQHAGTISRKIWIFTQEFNGTGRAMVDMGSFSRAEPNYSGWFAEISPNSSGDDDEGYGRRRNKGPKSNRSLDANNLSNEALACMIPFVYGFSFTSKVWGQMHLDNITDIKFRENAWEQLVLDPEEKDLMLTVVGSKSLNCVDFIDNKGGGAIFLLFGPPGVGKTLTAEAAAETLQRPLYAVGIGELGTNVATLETNLTRILETAAAWGAVLLLDEADIFLEQRSEHDVHRNAMVAVFLRLLEYYQGVLFLTSNRAKEIDTAFYSRVTMAIHYHNLDKAARVQVWTNVLSLYGDKVSVTPDELQLLADHEKINGRQIKNVIRMAVTWATAKGLPAATFKHLERVIHKVQDFNPKADTLLGIS